MNPATCKTCPWWTQNAYMVEHNKGGECRRNAPVVVELPGEFINWPITTADDWCGEHPDRQPHLEGVSTTLAARETFPTESDMRRISDALEKMATCAAVKP